MVVLKFSREADMTSVAVRAARALAAPAGARAFLEYESTNGMPDIVFAQFDAAAVEVRARGPLSPVFCERADVSVLLALEESSFQSTNDLADRTHLTLSTVGARLRRLEAIGAVARENGRWRRLAAFSSRLASATAVELKLADWRKALDQAARYRAFAGRSLVVLNEERAQAARRHRDVFSFNGIGLSALSPWGEVEEIVPTPAGEALDRVSLWVAGERLWARAAATVEELAA